MNICCIQKHLRIPCKIAHFSRARVYFNSMLYFSMSLKTNRHCPWRALASIESCAYSKCIIYSRWSWSAIPLRFLGTSWANKWGIQHDIMKVVTCTHHPWPPLGWSHSSHMEMPSIHHGKEWSKTRVLMMVHLKLHLSLYTYHHLIALLCSAIGMRCLVLLS